MTLARRWKRNGAVISGATGSTYTLVAADLGKAISVEVPVKVTPTADGYTTLVLKSAQRGAIKG